jgi:hypothetical protein
MKEKYEDKGFWLSVEVMVGAGSMETVGVEAEFEWYGKRVATRIIEEAMLNRSACGKGNEKG